LPQTISENQNLDYSGSAAIVTDGPSSRMHDGKESYYAGKYYQAQHKSCMCLT